MLSDAWSLLKARSRATARRAAERKSSTSSQKRIRGAAPMKSMNRTNWGRAVGLDRTPATERKESRDSVGMVEPTVTCWPENNDRYMGS